MNQDPNNLVSAQPAQLLPTIEASIGVALGDDYYPYGNIWSQYFTQSAVASQYKTIDQYLQVNADFNYAWMHLYQNALINDQLMITNSRGNTALVQYLAIGYVLKAYGLQLATDAFGDIPMNQALQGTANKNPAYDPQATVYDTIFSLLEQGKALMNNSDPHNPGATDLIFQGNMNNWIAFANTLELRAYLRLTQVDAAKAKAGVQALYASNPSFLTTNAQISYTATGGNQNPFYIKEVALGQTVNLAASGTVVNAFVRNNDPRQFAVFDTIPGTVDTVIYLPQGAYASFTNKVCSTPAALVAGNPQDPNSALAPLFLISAAESYFLQAEAVARGWATGSASSLFTQGIQASFGADGIPAAAAAYLNYAPDAQFPAAPADEIKAIITQKYYAMCGSQGFEAWTEWRRTGYPSFFVPSAANGGRTYPLRFLYPQSELTGNLNYPGTVAETTPVWWDK
ncbi:SusD/RagB family nutrient-binding outer membrane lipoprotein [Puia dinghuensis]|uniref:SusD/RagB family nutrient-binding outer membrane lipoprotein n=1 Tax=Puia dinghuensis TaxID=1792502 RepID=UPI001E2E7437|nr:SusD/RagB family nutrient-binding outer membrane lipoprotein [Puia dinghuensis]